ncbi:MAG: type II toxin-antitoxin system YafQ family toxin [Candidatus Solibacter usitatus]|nr:type II toxin-antitoxin system YafQ family toxin [Candidatus Solibacter usitatus]
MTAGGSGAGGRRAGRPRRPGQGQASWFGGRDVKLAQKRGKDMAKMREAILPPIEGSPLPPRYKDHALSGEWKRFRGWGLRSGRSRAGRRVPSPTW